jgi:predicted transcriptional regulator
LVKLQLAIWRKVENIIRPNKKGTLIEFLFVTSKSQFFHQNSTKKFKCLEKIKEKLQALQNEVNSIKQNLNSL